MRVEVNALEVHQHRVQPLLRRVRKLLHVRAHLRVRLSGGIEPIVLNRNRCVVQFPGRKTGQALRVGHKAGHDCRVGHVQSVCQRPIPHVQSRHHAQVFLNKTRDDFQKADVTFQYCHKFYSWLIWSNSSLADISSPGGPPSAPGSFSGFFSYAISTSFP